MAKNPELRTLQNRYLIMRHDISEANRARRIVSQVRNGLYYAGIVSSDESRIR